MILVILSLLVIEISWHCGGDEGGGDGEGDWWKDSCF